MFKKVLSILILIIFIFSINSALASESSLKYTQSVRAKIMENFKNEQYDNIFNSDNVLLSTKEDLNFFETINKNEKFEKIRQKLLEAKKEVEEKKDSLTVRRMNLEQTVAELDTEIDASTQEIASLNREVLKLSAEVTTLESEVLALQKEIAESKKVLLEYISHIYKKQNIVFDGSEVDSLKTILLNNGDISEVLNDIHFSSILEVTGQSLLDKHRKLAKDLFVKKLDMESKIEKLKSLRSQEVIKRKTLLEKKDFRQRILDYTKGQESLFEQYLNNKEESDKKMQIRILQNKIIIKEQKEDLLKKYNCNYIDFNNLTVKDLYLLNKSDEKTTGEDYSCLDLNKILQAESSLKGFPIGQQNVFDWPVEPTRGLSAYYKDPEYTDVVGSTHDAIDIREPQGTDIKAPADGYVTFLKAPTDEGYAYVVLKHADGFVTVYGHISDLMVKQYDFIKKGEVFAKSGGEFGTNGAGLMTTGPHLHFEVYKDKEYVDPLDYLDLSELGEGYIPTEQKYIYKFMDDYRLKNGAEYDGELSNQVNTFNLTGESEVDRQKNLLARYATPEFQDWNIWVEESIDGNVDPSFVMCLGLAETGLGRNLKTPYNIGNVGNTDSGAVKNFQNARSGVYSIVSTLNNKFLGSYTKLNQLSRYGNKDGAIYASSPLNWHRNITRCLTALKQKSVPDDFNFRIGE